MLDEIMDVGRFEPRESSLDYLKEIDQAVHEIDAHRPLSDEQCEALEKEILYDRVRSSAVTEGNRLSRRETITLLSSGVIEAGGRKDQLEVRNLSEAILYLQKILDEKDAMTLQRFRELHRLLLREIDESTAGSFRNEDVAISGAKFVPPNYLEIPILMEHVLGSDIAYDDQLPAIQRAAWIHWAVSRVHPFKDGNGRVARLVQDYVLIKSGYVPATIQPEDREQNYYEALELADQGQGKRLLELIAKNTLRVAEKYLSVLREKDTRDDWLSMITATATEKARQTNHRKYLSFTRTTNSLRLELDKVVPRLQQIPNLHVHVTDYGTSLGGIDYEKYESLSTRGRAEKTWYFGIEFWFDETLLRYIFWYGKHYSSPYDEISIPPTNVTIILSVEENGRYVKLDDVGEDRVSLRELIPSDGGFTRLRYNPVDRRVEFDFNVSAGQVIRDFIVEVLSKLGLA